MDRKPFVEYIQLDQARKWQYMKRYYEVASKFFDIRDRVVSDEEVSACIQKFKVKPNPLIRKEMRLNEWKFKFNEDDQGVQEGYFEWDCEETDWETVKIPHSYRYIPPKPVKIGSAVQDVFKSVDKTIWYGTYDTWYRCLLSPGLLQDEQTVYLQFDSINLQSDVWVNESPVMLSHLGLFPYEMEITDDFKGMKNNQALIAVRARNIVSNKSWLFYNGFQMCYYNPPYTSGSLDEDWYDDAWAGIAGDARLLILNRCHLREAFLFTETIGEDEALLKCRLNLRNTSWTRFEGKIKLEISPWLPTEGEVVETLDEPVTILPMNENRLEIPFRMKNPNLWDIDHPNLYLAHIVLFDSEGKAIDDLYETFGIRTIKIVGVNYYLNNKKMYPRGTHDICRYWNDSLICPSDQSIVKDILYHKKAGANCSRWPSDTRIHYKKIADYCDQLGYMLSWTGYFEVWEVHPEMELYALRDAKAMVRSLWNCPSIIIWEMGDEPLLANQGYRRLKWFEQIYNLVKAEDQSRPILPAGHFSGDLLEIFEKYDHEGLTAEQVRDKVLSDYPLYNLELAYWDIHWTIMHSHVDPIARFINQVKRAFGGQRLSIVTEFGVDALPKPENVADIYGKFRWASNPLWYRSRKKDDSDYYGRLITQADWKETQAFQSISLSTVIGYLRESPAEFAGFYFMMMFDAWTYYQGVVDMNGNCKLGYFVTSNLLQPIYISGLHGNTVLAEGDTIEITVNNLEEPVTGASLSVSVLDDHEQVVRQATFADLEILGQVSLMTAGKVSIKGLAPGMYSLEYSLRNAAGKEIGRMVELFFLEGS